jgi:hypothetical protein
LQKIKNVQLPLSFLANVLLLIYCLDDYHVDLNIANRCKALEAQIQAKIDALSRREAFSKYKTAAAGSDERERLRRQYLELALIHKDWISSNEFIP